MPLSALLTKFKAVKPAMLPRLLAVEITPETVKTAVWQVDEGKTQVVTVGEVKEWDGQEATLVTAVDESLGTALESIEPEPNRVVLGLPDAWVSGTTINDDTKKLLKAVASKLELKFVGFVVTSEAIVHEMKRQEGTPLTAIILTVTEAEVNVQVVHLGKVLGSELVGRSQDIGTDVEEGLARMKISEPLPARMILTDGHLDLEAVRQNLLSYDWQGRLNFLHVPKIDILERDFSIRAVAQAGGSEAAKSLGLETMETAEAEGVKAERQLPPAPGFIADVDVATQVPMEQTEQAVPPVEPEKVEQAEAVEIREPAVPPVEKISRWQQVKGKLKQWRWPAASWRVWKIGWIPLVAAGLVIAAIIAGIIMYGSKAKAQVTIYVRPQTLEQAVELIADPKAAALDVDKGIIAARNLEVKVEGGLERDTSGETVIGDKAKGTVTVYNKTTQAKTFAKGTILVGPKELKFALDQEVNVASSSSTTEGITFGKADGGVTAAQIGTESNLSADTEFTLANFAASSYSARNGSAFTGGTSKTARVVSKADQEALTDEVKDKLVGEAKDKLKAELASDEVLLEAVIAEEVVKQQFSKAVNEEADKVSLVMQLKLTMLAVKQADLNTMLLTRVQGAMPDNFKLEAENTKIEVKEVAVDDEGRATASVQAKLALVPELNTEEIKTRIKGRYPELVRDYFASLPSYERVDIAITPNLPKRLKRFPSRPENISIEVRIAE